LWRPKWHAVDARGEGAHAAIRSIGRRLAIRLLWLEPR
jgi:hypothetical protein